MLLTQERKTESRLELLSVLLSRSHIRASLHNTLKRWSAWQIRQRQACQAASVQNRRLTLSLTSFCLQQWIFMAHQMQHGHRIMSESIGQRSRMSLLRLHFSLWAMLKGQRVRHNKVISNAGRMVVRFQLRLVKGVLAAWHYRILLRNAMRQLSSRRLSLVLQQWLSATQSISDERRRALILSQSIALLSKKHAGEHLRCLLTEWRKAAEQLQKGRALARSASLSSAIANLQVKSPSIC